MVVLDATVTFPLEIISNTYFDQDMKLQRAEAIDYAIAVTANVKTLTTHTPKVTDWYMCTSTYRVARSIRPKCRPLEVSYRPKTYFST